MVCRWMSSCYFAIKALNNRENNDYASSWATASQFSIILSWVLSVYVYFYVLRQAYSLLQNFQAMEFLHSHHIFFQLLQYFLSQHFCNAWPHMFCVLRLFRKGSQGTADSLSQFAAIDFVSIYIIVLSRYRLNATLTHGASWLPWNMGKLMSGCKRLHRLSLCGDLHIGSNFPQKQDLEPISSEFLWVLASNPDSSVQLHF